MKRIALYFRVSTDDQTTEPQRIELLEYCARRGWTNVQEFSDKISGSKCSRFGLDAMMRVVRAGKIDTVVCVKLDRLGRSLKHLAQLFGEFETLNVAMVCTSQGIDTTTENPMGKAMRGMLMVFSEFEKDMITERTCAGLAAARARGAKFGRPPKPQSETTLQEIAAFVAKAPGAATTYGELATRTGKSKSYVHGACARLEKQG